MGPGYAKVQEVVTGYAKPARGRKDIPDIAHPP